MRGESWSVSWDAVAWLLRRPMSQDACHAPFGVGDGRTSMIRWEWWQRTVRTHEAHGARTDEGVEDRMRDGARAASADASAGPSLAGGRRIRGCGGGLAEPLLSLAHR